MNADGGGSVSNYFAHRPLGLAGVNVALVAPFGAGYQFTGTNWNGTAPVDTNTALDRIAALLKTLNGGVGP